MDIKLFKIVLLITVTQFLLAFGCRKDSSRPCGFASTYSFDATAEWSPQKEMYKIGDTIFITSTLPKILHDNFSNKEVDYSNTIAIGGTIATSMIDTVLHNAKQALSKFDWIQYTGTIGKSSVDPEAGLNYKYAETPTNYMYKFAFVCKEKGIFLFGVSDLSCWGIKGKDCTKAGFRMTVTNSDKNIALYQYAFNFLPDSEGERIIYCFRVE